MFICNFKLNSKKLYRLFFVILAILAIIVLILSIFKIYKKSTSNANLNDELPTVREISSENFTNFLKDCHDNIDSYVGTYVKISGYVYRMSDFNEYQFVLSRTMIMDSTNNAVVVGILSEYENAKDFKDSDWVSIYGEIIKGNYNGEIPVVSVREMSVCEPPENEYVYPPTD